ncbi:histidine phosphatase family protein [Halomonas sp. PA5]|nr:histidine phosphatase family protein [Halomonas sp. PA5]
MRHGHSQANQQGIIVSDPQHGLGGFGLSSKGQEQLRALLTHWPWPTPTRIIHSDFLRTTETARFLATHFGLEMAIDTRLRERFFGSFDGQSDERYPDIWAIDATDACHRHAGIESVKAVATRMRATIDELEALYSDDVILLVSHGDPLQILLTALTERPLREHRKREALLPASITLLG